MRPGQRVSIAVDAYDGTQFEGTRREHCRRDRRAFSLLPPENASGNFVKVVQRVPVKIVLDGRPGSRARLRPGMSVTSTVYTR